MASFANDDTITIRRWGQLETLRVTRIGVHVHEGQVSIGVTLSDGSAAGAFLLSEWIRQAEEYQRKALATVLFRRDTGT